MEAARHASIRQQQGQYTQKKEIEQFTDIHGCHRSSFIYQLLDIIRPKMFKKHRRYILQKNEESTNRFSKIHPLLNIIWTRNDLWKQTKMSKFKK